jgi:tRNA (cmo5U34)-methyltransferase
MKEIERTMIDAKYVFDHAAADYDRTRRQYIPCFDDFYGTALALIPYQPKDQFRILDLGAGTGLLSALAAAVFPDAHFTLADISSEMLSKARERFAGRDEFTYQLVDYINQPLVGQYDVIVSGLSLHHVEHPDLPGVFVKIYDALASSGMFINADQSLGTTPENESQYQQAWLAGMRGKGCSEADIAVALERIKVDRTATLENQLGWLRAAGFEAVEGWYKNYRFTVYSGRKP